ncbi:hypothetical protein [Bradyrhizobium vignae]|uniref:hypothetical protein n=1 Tax=Bradyrhizobium vignae TaxID=1549949 RepID=UPI000EFDCC09|nr:hypothetical protein [Bradyrhizobium vignae]
MTRDAQFMCEDIAHDSSDRPLTIDNGRSGGAVIDDEAIGSVIHFQKCHAGQLLVVSEPNEPTSNELRAPG